METIFIINNGIIYYCVIDHIYFSMNYRAIALFKWIYMKRLMEEKTHQEHRSLRTDTAIDGLCTGPLVQTRAGLQT